MGFSGNFTQATLTGDTFDGSGGSRAPADTIVTSVSGSRSGSGLSPRASSSVR